MTTLVSDAATEAKLDALDDDEPLDHSWESPCPVWCTTALVCGEWGHSGDDVPLHAGTIGTLWLDGVLYAVNIESAGDGPPEVSLFHDGHTGDGLRAVSAADFLSLAPVLLSRFERTLADLYRALVPAVPQDVPDRRAS